jgi:hypothetical protein
MGDDKQHRGEPDRSRINLGEDYEVRYWTKTLGVTEERLREAVKRAGSNVAKVRAELGMVDESTQGNMGPTGSGGAASESPSPGHPPSARR